MEKHTENPTHFQIRNWERFQHYKKRNPPWVKLHISLLSSKDWVMLNDSDRVLEVAIMMLASQNGRNGVIPNDPEYIMRVAYLNNLPDFTNLVKCGFLTPYVDPLADASTLQADARPEAEQRQSRVRAEQSQSRSERDSTESPSIGSADRPATDPAKEKLKRKKAPDVRWFFELWNEATADLGLPQVETVTETRKRSARARLREHGEEKMKLAIEKVQGSKFLQGYSGRESWKGATADWVLKPSNFAKIIEGNYDDRGSAKAAPKNPAQRIGESNGYSWSVEDIRKFKSHPRWDEYLDGNEGLPGPWVRFEDWLKTNNGQPAATEKGGKNER